MKRSRCTRVLMLSLCAGLGLPLAAASRPDTPAAPTDLSVSAAKDGRILVQWRDNSQIELGFRIVREPAFAEGVVTVGPDTSQFEDYAGRGNFVYTIVAFNDAGESPAAVSEKVSVRTGVPGPHGPITKKDGSDGVATSVMVPAPPRNLRARVAGNDVRLDWREDSDAQVYFEVNRETSRDGTWGDGATWRISADAAAYVDPAGPGLHRYRVRAGNDAGASAYSGWSICLVSSSLSSSGSALPPAAPSRLTASDVGGGRAMVSWSDNSLNETGFVIERDPAFVRGAVNLPANATSYIDQSGNGVFRYHVRSVNDAGKSDFTPWGGTTVASAAPTAPNTPPPVAGTGNEHPAGSSSSGGIGGGGSGPAAGGSTSAPGGSCGGSQTSGSVGPDGWTVITPCSDSRIVYVSSSGGDDSNTGLSESAPKRTIAAGYALIRDGSPDWLLLKSGDVWTNEYFRWSKGGRSENEKMVVGSYGSGDRPFIKSGADSGFGASTNSPKGHLAILDLHLAPHTYDGSGQYPPYGISILNAWSDVLVENCLIEKYFVNFNAQDAGQGPPSHIAVRRCVIVDAFTTGDAHSQGLIIGNTDGVLLEENVLDHNGWSETISGALPTVFRQNVYLHQTNTNVVTRGNLSARASHCALSQRAGGSCEDNLLLQSPLGIQFGTLAPGTNFVPSGVIRNNIVMGSRNVRPDDPLGIGIWVTNGTGVELAGNIIAQTGGGSTGNVKGMNFDGSYRDLNIHDNIVYKWCEPDMLQSSIGFQGGLAGALTFARNDLQQPGGGFMIEYFPGTFSGVTFSGSRYNTPSAFYPGSSYQQWVASSHEQGSVMQAVSYPDPERTVATYMQTMGGSPTLDAFMAEARRQRRGSWRSQYTAHAVNQYLRAGFGR